jgi:spermidine synthase
LSLEHEPGQRFDTLILDAFSGDSIPVHLLTREAFLEYDRHLESNAVVAVHISSNYVDLSPVVGALAAVSGRYALRVETAGSAQRQLSLTSWILVSENREFLREVSRKLGGTFLESAGRRPWTDQYSNVLSILR